MPQNVLEKTIKYHGFSIYKHRVGKIHYYAVPALGGTFTTLKAVKTALDKLEKDMTRMEKEKRGGRRK